MKLYYVTYENDIKLNLDGRSGCYSSAENAWAAINLAEKSGYFEESIEDMMKDGVLMVKEIEG